MRVCKVKLIFKHSVCHIRVTKERVSSKLTVDRFIFTDLIKSHIMKQFTVFFIFTGGEGFQLGNGGH